MTTTWALVTTSGKFVIGGKRRILKLIQLIVSKSFMLDVVPWNDDTTIHDSELELHQKIKFVKDIFELEEHNISELDKIRNTDGLKETLRTVQEFYLLLHPADSLVQDLLQKELTELDGWKSAPAQHKSFIVQVLHSINYLEQLDIIKKDFRRMSKNPPSDDYCVYEQLNIPIMEFLDSTQ